MVVLVKGMLLCIIRVRIYFSWVGVHAECSVVMERAEVLGWGKVCFLYVGDVYIVFGEEVV